MPPGIPDFRKAKGIRDLEDRFQVFLWRIPAPPVPQIKRQSAPGQRGLLRHLSDRSPAFPLQTPPLTICRCSVLGPGKWAAANLRGDAGRAKLGASIYFYPKALL